VVGTRGVNEEQMRAGMEWGKGVDEEVIRRRQDEGKAEKEWQKDGDGVER
jgi:hypothetical protein